METKKITETEQKILPKIALLFKNKFVCILHVSRVDYTYEMS